MRVVGVGLGSDHRLLDSAVYGLLVDRHRIAALQLDEGLPEAELRRWFRHHQDVSRNWRAISDRWDEYGTEEWLAAEGHRPVPDAAEWTLMLLMARELHRLGRGGLQHSPWDRGPTPVLSFWPRVGGASRMRLVMIPGRLTHVTGHGTVAVMMSWDDIPDEDKWQFKRRLREYVFFLRELGFTVWDQRLGCQIVINGSELSPDVLNSV